jgi:hypothetical protein
VRFQGFGRLGGLLPRGLPRPPRTTADKGRRAGPQGDESACHRRRADKGRGHSLRLSLRAMHGSALLFSNYSGRSIGITYGSARGLSNCAFLKIDSSSVPIIFYFPLFIYPCPTHALVPGNYLRYVLIILDLWRVPLKEVVYYRLRLLKIIKNCFIQQRFIVALCFICTLPDDR